jgi:pseudouridylate synthase
LTPSVVVYSPEVAQAKADGDPIVALESTLIAHGLPSPQNLEVAADLERLVRSRGAVPATIAVIDGVVHIGMEEDQLKRVALDPQMRKIGLRDLPVVVATGASGGTTVSATAYLAEQAGIRVFATGGLGGVHRDWHDSRDESADLLTLSRTRVTVVCAGVKSILDIRATVERLETLNVTIVGYRTSTFPAFYRRSSGIPLDWQVDSPGEVAAVMASQDALCLPPSALVVANPLPAEAELDAGLHDRVLDSALAAATREEVKGQALTPFLLQRMMEGTGGASLAANLAAVRNNVELGARIAVAWRERSAGPPSRRSSG